ncbi:hypothetical protein [Halobaculum sp. D14]|uniref:hypothetical protein n=1 Tax=Halobaculum sp. D14 TaxID=3421642 RepID=UPI003EBE271D
MSSVTLENPVVFGAVVTVLWTGLWTGAEAVLFDGDLAVAAVSGAVGGVAFSVVWWLLRRSRKAETA